MGQHQNVVVKPTGAVTATGNSADLVNRESRGIVLAIKTTAHSGTTPTMTVKVQGKGANGYYDIPGAVTGTINSDTTTLLTVYPGVEVTANLGTSQPLPRIYRVVWTLGGTSPSFTFTVDGMLLV